MRHSTLSTHLPALSSALATRPTRKDPVLPSPAPPDIDFNTIDDEKKAILLPAVSPAVLPNLVNGMVDAVERGVKLDGTVQLTFNGSTQGKLAYSIQDPASRTMLASGTLGGAAVQESWTLNDDGSQLRIKGTVGAATEDLTLTSADDGDHLDGSVGSVTVHQVETTDVFGDGFQGLVDQGTINGVALHDEVNIQTVDPGSPYLHAEGNLGDAPIKLDERITAQDGANMSLSGEGIIAGTPVTVSQTYQTSPAT